MSSRMELDAGTKHSRDKAWAGEAYLSYDFVEIVEINPSILSVSE
jgi:hypothetical protein